MSGIVLPLESAPTSIRSRWIWRRAALVVPIAFAAALAVHFIVLQRFPNSGDEYAYLWQARAFALGEVTAATPQPQDAFRLNHIGDVDGRRFCKYPPGWPLLLAAGVMAGAPALVNPLLAGLALAGIYLLGCAWITPRAAILGVAVTMSSPFFLFNAASYHSHPSCLFAVTVMAVALTWAVERPGAWPLLLAGAGFGLAVLIRPYTACLMGLPLAFAFSLELWRAGYRGPAFAKYVMWFGAGGVPFACVLLFVNQAVTGSWTTLPWTLYDSGERLGFGVYGHTLLRGLKTTIRLCAEGILYTSLSGPVLAALAWRCRIRRRALLWILLCAPVAGYVFWWSDGGNRYGPRFYFEGLLAFTLLAGAGLERVSTSTQFRRVATAGFAVVSVVFVLLATHTYRQIYARRDVYRVVERAGLDRGIVLLQTASADMVRIDLTRNPPNVERERVLFGLSRGARDREVQEAFPDRKIYWYRWTPSGGILSPAVLP